MKLFLAAGFAALLLTAPLNAQTVVTWSAFSSGGGPITGNTARISGSLGGIAHAVSTAGNLRHEPGFWSGVPSASFSELPFLAIELVPGGNVQLSWPVTATGFTLEKATVIAPPNWSTFMGRPQQIDGRVVMTDPAVGIGYYRLIKP